MSNEARSTSPASLSDWDLIVATCHYRGIAQDLIEHTAYCAAWVASDGYGRLTLREIKARHLLGDWSHVRDASPEATKAAAAAIRQGLGADQLQLVAERVAANLGRAIPWD